MLSNFWGILSRKKFMGIWRKRTFLSGRPARKGWVVHFWEAMGAGLPIIGTPVGGIVDFLKDKETGLFSKIDDASDLAEK